MFLYPGMLSIARVLLLFLGGNLGQEEDWDPWPDTCESLDPGNGTAQRDSPPFDLRLTRDSISWDQAVHLTLGGGPPLATFTGFMVQARDDRSGEAVGEFDTDNPDVRVVNCFSRPDNTAMHANFTPKTEVRLRWAPEKDEEGSVTFYYAVAQEVEPLIYWANQRSHTVQIKKAKSGYW